MAFEVVGMSAEDQAAWQAALAVPGNVEIEISSAQLKALNSSPVELIPAQGANKVIAPISVVAVYSFVSTAYENASAPDLFWGSVSLGLLYNFANNVAAATESKFNLFAGNPGSEGFTLADVANAPLNFTDAADWTLGDGTLKFLITYTVFDAS